jgi:hypothetical protein
VLSRKDTIGSDEDGNSTTTLETQPSLVSPIGSILIPIAGEYQSPTKALGIQEMEPLQIPKGAKGTASEKGAFPGLSSSSLNGIQSATESADTEKGKPMAAPGLLRGGNSLRRKSPKKGRPKEKYQKLGSEDPSPTRKEENGSPPTFAVKPPGDAEKKRPTDTTRRASFSKSVSRLMRGKRVSNPDKKPKKGQLREAISSSFGKQRSDTAKHL